MNGYQAFLKKEWMESVRTYRLLIVVLVFTLFGITSPLMAKLLPELIGSMDMGGIQITLPIPTALDSYTQFFKNITQIGIIVFVLVFSGCISQEVQRGTLINVLTKGLSRKAVILAKFTMIVLLWSLALCIASIATVGYTWFLFSNEAMLNPSVGILCLWVFGILLIALLCLGSTLFKSTYGGLLFLVLVIASMFILSIFPNLQSYNPIYLVSANLEMLQPTYDITQAVPSLCVSLFMMVLSLGGSIFAFQRKQL